MYLKCVSTSTGVKGRLIKEHWRRDDRLFFLSPGTSNLNGSSDEFSQILSVILYIDILPSSPLTPPTLQPYLPSLSSCLVSEVEEISIVAKYALTKSLKRGLCKSLQLVLNVSLLESEMWRPHSCSPYNHVISRCTQPSVVPFQASDGPPDLLLERAWVLHHLFANLSLTILLIMCACTSLRYYSKGVEVIVQSCVLM